LSILAEATLWPVSGWKVMNVPSLSVAVHCHRRALVRRRAGEPGDPDSRAKDGAQRSASVGDGVEGDLVVAVGGSALGGGLAGAPSATLASTRWATGLPGDSGAKVRVCPTPPTATHCDVVGHTA
jgi:hypothetical protein